MRMRPGPDVCFRVAQRQKPALYNLASGNSSTLPETALQVPLEPLGYVLQDLGFVQVVVGFVVAAGVDA